jgi:hypothetical protein
MKKKKILSFSGTGKAFLSQAQNVHSVEQTKFSMVSAATLRATNCGSFPSLALLALEAKDTIDEFVSPRA